MAGSGVRLGRLALIGALFMALGVAGCGRKSGLDPPPAAQLVDPAPNGTPGNEAGVNAEGREVAPQVPRRRFFMDWLLD